MQAPTQAKIVYLDTPEITEVYANHVRVVSFEAGVVRVELCVDREGPTDPQEMHRYPTVRFALPAVIANDLISKLQKVGEMVRLSASNPPTKQ